MAQPGLATFVPFSRISPLSGTSSPAITRSIVVFPQPLGPRMTAAVPAATSRDTLSSATCDPKRFVTSLSVMAAAFT
jgi:hypothetical protein